MKSVDEQILLKKLLQTLFYASLFEEILKQSHLIQFINPFHTTDLFTPWNHLKNKGFLMSSGVTERRLWYKMS